MKILFLGPTSPGQTSRMRLEALARLGHCVRSVNTQAPWLESTSWLKRQVQRRTQRGSIIDEINSKIIEAAEEFRPTLVWAEKQEFLRAETLSRVKQLGARLLHFTPD